MEIGKSDQVPAITFRLDRSSGAPTYQQIVRQVEDALRLGYLRAGDQLPTVKDVAVHLAINPNTVLKAYRDLELKGLATGRPGQGTFVPADVELTPHREVQALRRKLVRWRAEAVAAGLDAASIAALFSTVCSRPPSAVAHSTRQHSAEATAS